MHDVVFNGRTRFNRLNLNHDSHISRESVQVVRSSGIASDLSDADMTHCPINELQKPF